MHVTLNGEQKVLRDGLTVAGLVAELGLAERRIAIEINGKVVVRTDYTQHRIVEADEIEIVQFVGGG